MKSKILALFICLLIFGCDIPDNGKKERDIALFTNGFLNGYVLMQQQCIRKTYLTSKQVDSIATIKANEILDKITKP